MAYTQAQLDKWIAEGRGRIRPTTADEAVARWLAHLSAVPLPPSNAPADAGNRPIAYRLTDQNGGDDPLAVWCCDWSYGLRTPTSDCIGFVLHGSGIDRLQPKWNGPIAGPWLYCKSIVHDAKTVQTWVEKIPDHAARPGDWLVDDNHIAGIIRPAIYVQGSMQFDHLVIDCSPRHGRSTAIGIGAPWSEAAFVVRPKFYTDAA